MPTLAFGSPSADVDVAPGCVWLCGKWWPLPPAPKSEAEQPGCKLEAVGDPSRTYATHPAPQRVDLRLQHDAIQAVCLASRDPASQHGRVAMLRSHSMGTCRPCPWFWREGCANGDACKHCHLCSAAQELEYRREKKVRRRKLRRSCGTPTSPRRQ